VTDTFKIELLSDAAKEPTPVNCMCWTLSVSRFAHNEMRDVTFDLSKTFYGSKLNGRATKNGYMLHPRGRVLIGTGLSIEVPDEYYVEIMPVYDWLYLRGLMIERKTIMDGEIDFVAVNLGHKPIELKKGDVVAQFMMKPVYNLDMEVIG
jgi:dUTPase